jgi:transposase
VELRPIFHWRKRENVNGHIFVCFLALYLAALLRRKLAQAGIERQWGEVMGDLCSQRAVTLRLAGEDYRLRTPLKGAAG